jgi:hypothetical protein
MKLELLQNLYETNHLSDESFQLAKTFLLRLDGYLKDHGNIEGIDQVHVDEMDTWVAQMVSSHENDVDHFVAMMRYFRVTKQHEIFVRLTQYTGALDVIESIYGKMNKVLGKERAEGIQKHFPVPVLGTDIVEINRFTEQLMTEMKGQTTELELKKILTDNHHLIPRDAFKEERIMYEASPSLDAYLKDLHQRKVEELTRFFEQDRVWYEQIITRDVIDFVRENPEIMSGVLKDDALYITKIPYDTNQYIKADNDQMRSYHACHCPFAKASILESGINIDAGWCYCSAGFTKLPFEVALNQELPIECISTALKGDPLCRFKIDLSQIDYKK